MNYKELRVEYNSTINKQKQKQQVVQVAHELVALFDVNITASSVTLNVRELLSHCVGVHRAYAEIYNQKEIFFKLKNPKLYKNGLDLIFLSEIQCKTKEASQLIQQGYNLILEDGCYNYKITCSMARNNPTRKDYANLSSQIRNKGIWYFIGNNGYTMYLSNSNTCRYSQESIIYMVMFYLGSITRYHPYMFDKIFSDKEQWLMSEFLHTQPKQFLYLATSRVLGQNVLKAYASF